MKVLGAGAYISPDGGFTPGDLIQFALSQDVDVVISGCSTPGEAEFLARQEKDHAPMDEEKQAAMVDRIRPYAEELAYYRGVI